MNNDKIFELADECLGCIKKPCKEVCPLNNDTTEFINIIKQAAEQEKNVENKANNDKEAVIEKIYKEAFNVLARTTVLMPICGRVCPHTKQCQGGCVKKFKGNSVQIGELEAFIGDMALKNNWKLPTCEKESNYKVAIVGGGPAGLTCAQFLRRAGVQVTIYEKYNYLGGILKHGIPDFRLDKNMLEKWIDKIIETGIKVKYNMELGKDFSIQSLEKEYDAIFLGFGANISSKMGIPGEDLEGVFGGNELLENNLGLEYKGKTVVVSGGGNVAMDVSRTAIRNGAKKVYVVYRRSEKEMPAEQKEIEEAKAEGVEFLFQNNILKVIGEKKVQEIECIKTELIQKEGDSRLSPVNIEGSNYTIPCDLVIMAIGSMADKKVTGNLGVELDRRGKIVVDEYGKTSKENIFAGGDIAGNMGTVAYAARAGRNSAESIIEYLNNKESDSQTELWNKLNENNTLQEVQQYIKSVIKIRGFSDQEIEKTMLLLLEEVGELAKSIRKNATNMSIDTNKINHYDTIESEVADVFIVLNSVCNKLNIDLYKALKDKEEENINRKWNKDTQ